MKNLVFVLATDDSKFKDLINGFFAGIIKFLYKLLSSTIDLMYDLAEFDFQFDDYIDSVFNKIFFILAIFMIFKLTFSIMNYLIKPDDFTDSNKGFQKIIQRVIISVIALISINPLFSLLKDLQSDILKSDFITSLLADTGYGETIEFTNGITAYGVRMNDDCASGKFVYTFTQGDHISLMLLKPFIQPYSREEINVDGVDYYEKYTIPIINGEEDDTKYCGVVWDFDDIQYIEGADKKVSLRTAIPGPNSAEGFMYKSYYNALVGLDSTDKNYYLYDFNYFFALIFGLLALLIVISFCFDVVIRTCTLLILKMIAPIPIISYVSPQGKASEMLGNWLKKVGSVWASLFIRIAILDICINFIGIACSKLGSSDASLAMQIFIILGILMFAKKLPGLLEELIPGLKLSGGFQLNPLKRIENDAVGGKYIAGAYNRAIGAASGMIGGTISGFRAGNEVGNKFGGAALGALSGAHTGFHNKKWSFDSGMNEAYKNLTGNELKRFSLSSSILNRIGKNPVDESKSYLNAGRGQLRDLNSRLSEVQRTSSSLANILAQNGYDVSSTAALRNDIGNKINNSNANIRALNDRNSELNDQINTANQTVATKQAAYNNAQSNYERNKNEYESANQSLEAINKQLSKAKSELDAGGMIGAFQSNLESKIKELERQRATLESSALAKKTAFESSKSRLDFTSSELSTAKNNVTNIQQEITQNNTAITNERTTLTQHQEALTTAQNYINSIQSERDINQRIEQVQKDVDVISKEKSQRETFYRIDSAPQVDYEKARNNIDSRR